MSKYEKFLALKAKKLDKSSIIEKLNISVSTYYRYMKKMKMEQKKLSKRGRKELLSPSTKAYIRNFMHRGKYAKLVEIYARCQNLGKPCSKYTISRYLHSLGYYRQWIVTEK